MSSEQPKYRVLAENAFVNGGLYRKGSVVTFAGWPPALQLEPINEPAKRIAQYYATHRLNPFLPPSPWNAKLQRFHLAGVLVQWTPGPVHRARIGEEGKALPSPVRDGETSEATPAYEATADGWIGNRFVEAGSVIAFLGWAPPELLKPANPPAERAAAYFEQHKAHPGLLTSPWCYMADDLLLPDLPEVEPDRRRGGFVEAEKPRASTRKKSPALWDEFKSGAA